MEYQFHYEYAAYTDNLCWGRMLIAQGRDLRSVRMRAELSGKGCFVIEKVKVYELPKSTKDGIC